MNAARAVRLILVLAMASSPVCFGGRPAGAAGALFTLRASSPSGWDVGYAGQASASTHISIDGQEHILFTPRGPSKPGEPALPVHVLTLGIPFGTTVSAQLVDPVYEETPQVLIAPAPTLRAGKDGAAVESFLKNASIYSSNSYLPVRPLEVGECFTLRGQRLCPIRLSPYQYNPVSKTLRRLRSATIQIRTTGGSILPSVAAVRAQRDDPGFEEVFKSLVWNYGQAKAWRRPAARAAGIDPTRAWFQTGQTYERIQIAHDGWYQVTQNDLRSAGATGSPDPSSYRLIRDGREVPLILRADSSLCFYGTRHYGDTTYYDNYTDTSVYWLTWGGQAGLRYLDATVSDSGGISVNSVATTSHQEQNTALYRGATQAEIINSDVVAGEAWIWEYYYPGTSKTHSFVLDAVDTGSPAQASVRVRLFGTTSFSGITQQSALLWFNDSLRTHQPLGQALFAQRTGGVFSFALPVDSIRNGVNSLTLADTLSAMNQFYLDWFEVEYPRLLQAKGNMLVFADSTGAGGGLLKFTVTGFTDSTIEVFDPQGGRRIVGGQVSGNAGTGFSVVFRDTVSVPRTYVVVARSATQPLPGALRPKQFKDIRNDARGADYIIISHADFLQQAGRLAAHRESVSGVRARVIDVQDIYDEFNYGVFSAEPLKQFLEYAYRSWPRPAPSAVLLFGDASADFHHWLPNSVKVTYIPTYGNPVSDNWYVCFDSTYSFLPSMLIGRLTVQNTADADETVGKLIGYDRLQPDVWNKRFLFLTGGNDSGEQSQFNGLSDATIAGYVTPAPLGGEALRIYKNSTLIIDSTRRGEINAAFSSGVAFVNFVGHSGGSIWSLDAGPPSLLGNTQGALPFISSVSCNVSSFADQTVDNLSEQFVMADNRGAIAMWGTVSLGYAFSGEALTDYFLATMLQDTLRGLGALTTAARYKLWESSGSLGDYITIAMVKLTPLLGDPLTQMAIATKPDLALSPGDLSFNKTPPAAGDSSLALDIRYRNYGLVPADSVGLSLTDLSQGRTATLLADKKLRPTFFLDSVQVPVFLPPQFAKHTFTAVLDPLHAIDEVSKANNSASLDAVVSPRILSFLRPLENLIVPPGPYSLSVTDPSSGDSTDFRLLFDLDTVSTFDSPWHVASPVITPGPVNGTWLTPSLTGGEYFARVRTIVGRDTGSAATTMFASGPEALPDPGVRWEQGSKVQFQSGQAVNAAATDSGVVLAQGASGGSFSSEPIPYASKWRSLRWSATTLSAGADIRLKLLGFKSTGGTDTLRTYPRDSAQASLGFLDTLSSAKSYATIALLASLSRADTLQNPVLHSWSLDFEPPPDLAISSRTLALPAGTVSKGSPLQLSVTVYNIGYRRSDSCRVIVSVFDAQNIPHPVAAASMDTIGVNSWRTVSIPVPTASLSGKVNGEVDVLPAVNARDLIAQNNTAHFSFTVAGSPSASVRFFADGTQLMDGDYISPHPQLLVHGVGGDTSVVRAQLLVDGSLVGSTPSQRQEGGNLRGTTLAQDPLFTPTLTDGRHELRARLFFQNLVGGEDSLDFVLSVNVLSALRILHLLNYPNPFARDTYFTFVLTGVQAPDAVTIRVYTVAGRKIRQIIVPPGSVQIGFNRIFWDGRDNDGDEVANGYYFYQVSVESAGRTETALEKLVKVR